MWINRDEYEKLKADSKSDDLKEKYNLLLLNYNQEVRIRKYLFNKHKEMSEKLEVEKEAHERTANSLHDLRVDYRITSMRLERVEKYYQELMNNIQGD